MKKLLKESNINLHRIDMDFEGCLPAGRASNNTLNTSCEEELEGYQNYYYPHCPDGVLNIKQYNKVTYKNVYNDIDVNFYGNKQSGLKYDIIVKPNADPSQIKLHWRGVENIQINNEGHLKIKTSVNEFTESIPKVYQVINGNVVDIKAKYVLTGTTVNFELGNWNPKHSLIIDPWASYYGGSGWDISGTVTTDQIGNVAFTGYTTSNNIFISIGALQTTMLGVTDAFVVKMNSNGSLLWATYYGGSMEDHGNDISTDVTGNILVAGETNSPSLPLGPAAGNFVHQSVYGGSTDAFLLKLSPTGALLWATYYGGSGYDIGTGVVSDGNTIYLYGKTYSTNSISKAGAFQVAKSGGSDVFAVQFAANGNRNWATYVGGTLDENSGGIAVDLSGNVYIVGFTRSTNFPVSAGYQMSSGGLLDAFLFKFNNTGIRLWSTYYGGGDNDIGVGVTTDGMNNVIIGGYTKSTLGIATAGAFQIAYGGGTLGFGDAFITKFNSVGAIQWATYLGGNNDEWLFDITADRNNNIYVYGEWEDTDAGNLPISSCAYQPTFGGGSEDQFIAKYNPSGVQRCITYIGGSGHDDLEYYGGITINGDLLYITGNTGGSYPVSSGAFQTLYGGGTGMGGTGDVFINQLCINLCETQTLGLDFTSDKINVCVNDSLALSPIVNNSCDTSGYKFHWIFSGGNPATSDLIEPIVSYGSSGTYNIKLILTTACKKDSITKMAYITVNSCACLLSASSTILLHPTCSNNANGITMANPANGTPLYTYSWAPSGQTTQTATGLSQGIYTVTITDSGGCFATATATLSSPTPIIGQFNKGTANCASCGCKEWLMVTASGGTSPYSYLWPDGYVNRYKNQLCPGTYSINIKDKNGCSINVSLTAP
ncbi:MAG: SBBP repeat-containing protein [Bacteroidia bacterium]|nr:SBBP repeat-containing protein [Bacteroidia bacterium]